MSCRKVDVNACELCCEQLLCGRLLPCPPLYSELGKHARDLFYKGYCPCLLKLIVTTKTCTGVSFKAKGISNQDTGKVFGYVSAKYYIEDQGLSFTESWHTEDNILSAEVKMDECLLNVKGLRVKMNCAYVPGEGVSTGTIRTTYLNDCMAFCLDFDLFRSGPLIKPSFVIGHSGFLFGFQTAFDTQKLSFVANNFACGYTVNDFVLHAGVEDGDEFTTSIYHKVTPDLATGVSIDWTRSINETRYGCGFLYRINQDLALRAKANNLGQIGLGSELKISDYIVFGLSLLIDSKNMDGDTHRVGAFLKLEN